MAPLENPTAFVIFGGGGDLAWRKLVPALYNLALRNMLVDAQFRVKVIDLRTSHWQTVASRRSVTLGWRAWLRTSATT